MYTVNVKDMELCLNKAIDIVSLGNKTTAATVTLSFSKVGVSLAVSNQAGSYLADLACKVEKYVKSPPVVVVPSVLLSYIKGRKTVQIAPKPDGLSVVGTGGLNAKMFYVGEGTTVDIPDADTSEGMSIHKVGVDLLKSIESMKDRTEKKPMSGQLLWSAKDSTIEIVAGDSHHAAHIKRLDVKSKKNGSIILPFMSLKRVLGIGGKIFVSNNTAWAISENEKLMLNNLAQGESITVASINELYEKKTTASVVVKSADLSAALDTLIIGTDEGTPIDIAVNAEDSTMVCSVKTGAAKGSIKIKGVKVKKSFKARVLLLHLMDCMKCVSNKELTLNMKGNILHIEGKSDSDHVQAVVVLKA